MQIYYISYTEGSFSIISFPEKISLMNNITFLIRMFEEVKYIFFILTKQKYKGILSIVLN